MMKNQKIVQTARTTSGRGKNKSASGKTFKQGTVVKGTAVKGTVAKAELKVTPTSERIIREISVKRRKAIKVLADR